MRRGQVAAARDGVGDAPTFAFASDLDPALTGLVCALAALLLLLFLCVRTRLRRLQMRSGAPPLLADNVSEAQRTRLLELQFYLRSCMEYRALRLLPHVGAHEESAMALVALGDEPTPRGTCAGLYHALCGTDPAMYVLTVLPCRNAPLLHDAHAFATLQRLLVPPPRGAPATRPCLRDGRLTCDETRPDHPRVLRMRSFDFLPASGLAVSVRRWTPAGSLRDLLQGVSPEGEHGRKYFHVREPSNTSTSPSLSPSPSLRPRPPPLPRPHSSPSPRSSPNQVGKPLSETKCSAYGYHLLQAGLPHGRIPLLGLLASLTCSCREWSATGAATTP